MSSLDAGLLRAVRQNSSATYYCAGSLPLSSSLDLYFTDSAGDAGRLVLSGGALPADHAPLKGLLQAATPASFGRGGNAVLDPAYRSALELPPGSFGLNHVLPTAAMLADIHSILQPDAPAIEAQLYKLNVYGPGGHFKSHVDTPRSDAMFGSLVICLPSPFEGGQLLLRHNGATKTCDWGSAQAAAAATATATATTAAAAAAAAGTDSAAASSSTAAPDGPALQWVAFFSDVEHSIEPVTSGHRITMTYNLLQLPNVAERAVAGGAGQRLFRSADVAHTTPLYAELKRLLNTQAWHPEGATLGFFLEHKYAVGLRGLTESMFPGHFKGADRLLYAAVDAVGLEAKVVPLHIGWDENDEDNWRYSRSGDGPVPVGLSDFWEDTRIGKARTGSASEEDELGAYLKAHVMVGKRLDKTVSRLDIASKYECNNKDVARDLGGQPAADLKIIWCTRIPERGSAYYHDHISAYGNEPTTDIVYSGVGLLVEVPAWGSKERTSMIAAGDDESKGESGEVGAKRARTQRSTK